MKICLDIRSIGVGIFLDECCIFLCPLPFVVVRILRVNTESDRRVIQLIDAAFRLRGLREIREGKQVLEVLHKQELARNSEGSTH